MSTSIGISSIRSVYNDWKAGRALRSAFNVNQYGKPSINYQNFTIDKPSWISLTEPEHFEQVVRHNPVVKSAIGLLANSAGNARKVLVDTKTGEEIPWTDKRPEVQKILQLFIERPNPLQSQREFEIQGVFYHKTFGNRYINNVMPIGFDSKLDLMNIEARYNLPSQFIQVRTTGKIYKQTKIEGIIQEYARINTNPIEIYTPSEIVHFNEVNISSEMPSIMGISKLESLRMPITNTQYAFEAMNTILRSRGMQGIISNNSKDGTGGTVLLDKDKKELQKVFKEEYGLSSDQHPFLLSPVPLDYIKTIMNSKELGIYEEFASNALMIGNEFGVPNELIKADVKGATYENQRQSVRRLYENTTIPMVAEDDQQISYRYGFNQYGFKLVSKWDHIPVMQDAFKERAMAINLKGRTAKDAYTDNTITWNQYLEMIEQPAIKGGDVYKFERDKQTNTGTNGESAE